jgi:hypothetical protein
VINHLSEQAKHWVDAGAFAGAVIAGVSLANAALVVTIIAGLISIMLGLIRVHDRLKYGRKGYVE